MITSLSSMAWRIATTELLDNLHDLSGTSSAWFLAWARSLAWAWSLLLAAWWSPGAVGSARILRVRVSWAARSLSEARSSAASAAFVTPGSLVAWSGPPGRMWPALSGAWSAVRLLALLDFLADKLTVASRARFLAAVVAWATSLAARTFH